MNDEKWEFVVTVESHNVEKTKGTVNTTRTYGMVNQESDWFATSVVRKLAEVYDEAAAMRDAK